MQWVLVIVIPSVLTLDILLNRIFYWAKLCYASIFSQELTLGL